MKADDAKKIIETAVKKEIEAYTFYHGVADKAKNPVLKDFLPNLPAKRRNTVSSCRACSQRISRR